MALAATPRVRRIQTISLALLVTAGVVNYVDRATLAVANPLIREDLGLSIPEMGLLLSAFLWAYAFAQLPAGVLADRFGPRLTLTLGLTCWSFGQMLGGAVTSFWQFVSARIVLGIGEAPHFPTCARVSRDWFNIRQRGTATGIWNCASSLGTFLALPLLTFLMVSFGWRAMFVIMGAVGLVLAAIVYGVFRNPRETDLTPGERAFLEEGDAPNASRPVTWSAWRRLFGFRTSWGMIVGYFGCIYMTWLYTAWLPSYLEIERHFTLQKTGLVGSIPFAFGVLGGILGGRVVDMLVRRGVDPIRSRKIPSPTRRPGADRDGLHRRRHGPFLDGLHHRGGDRPGGGARLLDADQGSHRRRGAGGSGGRSIEGRAMSRRTVSAGVTPAGSGQPGSGPGDACGP